MNFLTRYRLRKALKQVEPLQEKKSIIKKIKPFIAVLTFGLFTPLKFALKRFAEWMNKQHKATIILVVLAILIFSFLVLNQLRYKYWLNIMQSEYPQEVLVVLDKVLIEWNARNNGGMFILFNMLLVIMLAITNHMYNSDEPQTIPGTYKLK